MNRFFFFSPLFLQTLIWPITRPIFCFFLHLNIDGDELAKMEDEKNKGLIFAVNHSSELDPILVPASLPFLSRLMPMFYVSREQSFYKTSGWRQFFYGGFFFKAWGAHPLRPGRQNYEESLKAHIAILEAGWSLCIFPEGKKTLDGRVGNRARGGVAYLAWRTGATVVPVRIRGIFEMSFKDFLLRKRFAEIVFGAPIRARELFAQEGAPSIEEIKASAQRVLDEIKKL